MYCLVPHVLLSKISKQSYFLKLGISGTDVLGEYKS